MAGATLSTKHPAKAISVAGIEAHNRVAGRSGATVSATRFPVASGRCSRSAPLALNPKGLLLDVLAEGLAPVIVDELLKALGAINRSGRICSIIVEQQAQKLLGLVDRVVILERGTIVHDAASAEVRADPAVLDRYLGVAGKS